MSGLSQEGTRSISPSSLPGFAGRLSLQGSTDSNFFVPDFFNSAMFGGLPCRCHEDGTGSGKSVIFLAAPAYGLAYHLTR